jgi:hypothetical protein
MAAKRQSILERSYSLQERYEVETHVGGLTMRIAG